MERKHRRLSIPRAGMAAVLLGALAPAANAQTSSLVGSVVDRYGVVVARAPVEARNTATEAIYRTFASDQANYELRRLPAGIYDVSVDLIGFLQYRRENVAVAPGESFRLDIQLEDGATLNTPGEFYFRRAVGKPPDGTAPRTSIGKPDFSGVWLPSANTNPEPPPILPAAEAQRKQRFSSGVTPRSLCLPTGIVLTPEIDLMKFVQTPNLLVILVEGGDPGFRQIFLDGREHPKDPFPDAARALRGPLGGRYADCRYGGPQRQSLADARRASANREDARRRTVSPTRPGAPGD